MSSTLPLAAAIEPILKEMEYAVRKGFCDWQMNLCGENVKVLPLLLSTIRSLQREIVRKDEALRPLIGLAKSALRSAPYRCADEVIAAAEQALSPF